MSKYDIDADQLKECLRANIASIVAMLLPGGKQVHSEWHVGSVCGEEGKSLRVALNGPKAGMWHDFATGEGGDILTLWMSARNLNFRDALKEAAEFVGVSPRIYTQSFSDEVHEGQMLCEKLRGVGLTMAERKRLTHIQKIIKVRDRLNY